jgi:LysR family transcriptional activator of nhaA
MSVDFSYRHLYYFWVVAKEGGMSRAADRLGIAVQTVSAQVRELEQSLGCALLKPAGRGLALTDAGEVAVRQADLIFQLGEELPDQVRSAASSPAVRLAVGIPDGIPKLAVRHLLEPVMQEPHLRLLCHDGELEDVLGELALHKLDIVISDRRPPPNAGVKFHSHPLSTSNVAWFGTPPLVRRVRKLVDGVGMAAALVEADVPVLLPTTHNVLRERIDRWFERHEVRPRIAGEFEDSALLKTFGAGGLGVFPAALIVEEDLLGRYGVQRIGLCEGVTEEFFAITPQKKVEHRLVERITRAAVESPRATAAGGRSARR